MFAEELATSAGRAVLVYSAIGVLWRDIRAIWAETVGLHLGSPEQNRLATLGYEVGELIG